jgi:ATPase subunit of ABC transporter with duplicated ATPase domains
LVKKGLRRSSYEGTLILVTHDRRMLDAVHVNRRLEVADGKVTER